MSAQPQDLYEFGPYRLDPRERVLVASGRPVSLTPKAFDTLLVLVQNHGHIVEKEELLRRVWPDTFVEEATLAKNVSTLRQILGDSHDPPQFIETVPKRGYRFVAEVRRPELRPGPEPSAPPLPVEPARAQSNLILAALAVGLILAASAFVFRHQLWPAANPPAPRIALAVLPFANLSGDAADDYLSDGLTEDMISRLGRLAPHHLAVIARTTSMRYRQSTKSAAEIGRELGVDYVLEGSVRHEGSLVRITAQLIETRTQTHVWAENYDRGLKEILPLQREVTEAIARQFQRWLEPQASTVLRAEAKAPLVEPEAHHWYLKGRYEWSRRTPESMAKSIEYYKRAIDIDPTYARAWTALAESYALQNEYGQLPPEEVFARSRAAALRAIEIDPSAAEAHAVLANARALFDWDWDAAEKDFRHAIQLNPNYATSRHWLAYGPLMNRGRMAEARDQLERARRLDPFSTSIMTLIGQTYYLERDYSRALDYFTQANKVTLSPGFGIYFHISLTLSQLGRHEEAVAAAKEGIRLSPAGDGREYLAYSHARAGRAEEARRLLEDVGADLAKSRATPFIIAGAYAALGEKEAALSWLDRCLERRVTRAAQVGLEPMFDPLRSDPRFAAIVRRVGVAQSPVSAARSGS